MNPEQFVATYLPAAKKVEQTLGFNYLIPLTQGAAESAWGKKAPGYNFFGVKALKDTPLNKKQLITTTEYLKSPNVKFPEIISVTPVTGGLFKYKVKDWFMRYENAEEAFTDHARFFLTNPRYKDAILVKDKPELFFKAIAKAGYATAPGYGDTLINVMHSVIKRFPK